MHDPDHLANVTPPSPKLEREEPEMWLEDDIPGDDAEDTDTE